MAFAVPVLTYHAAYIDDNAYAGNDHVAFARDLASLTRLGWKVVSLARVVDAVIHGTPLPGDKVVALTLDDATDFDFHDLDHPVAGRQRGIFGIVQDFLRTHGDAQPWLHVTSFAIVSPSARAELDRTCLIGRGWWSDGWWADAVASGRWSIGNHSWDHNHGALARTAVGLPEKGTFRNVDDLASADLEIAHAAAFLRSRLGRDPGSTLFAYPYGEHNAFLRTHYLPRHAAQSGTVAAFGIQGGPVTRVSDRWLLPRYVFRAHWRSPDGLEALLRDAVR